MCPASLCGLVFSFELPDLKITVDYASGVTAVSSIVVFRPVHLLAALFNIFFEDFVDGLAVD